MDRRFILLVFFLSLLLSPIFAEDYIITPPDNAETLIEALSANADINITKAELMPLYGTESFSAELTKDEAENLEAKGYEVYPDLEIHAFLDETAGQINITPVWNTTVGGVNLTGAEQTICIIDSGIDDVNYTVFQNAWEDKKILAGQAFFTNGSEYINQSCNSSNHFACFDDHGHGTEIAEIIASTNSTYQGIAYDANLVIVKVLDSDANGIESDLIQGINYCVSVAASYNISVISLSLGTINKTSSAYCDNDSRFDPALRDAVDGAAASGISVVAASGNIDSSINISAPACLSNATPVSSVSKSDVISDYSYWPLPILFAPGEDVYFPGPSGTLVYNSGTSMATPHVAGAFAIMRQYLALTDQSKTPSELESLTISTGKNLSSNHNQSRIDVYSLYLALADDQKPQIEINSPAANQYISSRVVTLNITLNEINPDYTVIYLNYTNGSLANLTNASQNGTFLLEISAPSDGNYIITAVSYDLDGNFNTTSISNLTIDTQNPQVAIHSPANNTALNVENITINLTTSDVNLNYTNISVYYANGTIANSSSNTTNGTYVVLLGVSGDGNYFINVSSYDNAGNTNSTASNITILAAPTLKIRPNWTSVYYQGNKTISAGEDSEEQNTSRALYYNLNQTKTILFYVNNSGMAALEDVSAIREGFGSLNTSLSWQDGSNMNNSRNISANTTAVLNLTIFSPESAGIFNGSIYINTTNGEPYTDANLTLVLNVTGQTLPRLNNSAARYYVESGNLTQLGFYIYYSDNQTMDTSWNSSYNISVLNSAGNPVSNVTFIASTGFFEGQLNATGLSEGIYNLSAEFNDSANNTAALSLPFEILQNAGLNASIGPNENLIVKGTNFTLYVNISKNGNYNLTNGTLCIFAPSNLNYTSNQCQYSVDLTGGSSKVFNWTVNGSVRGDYTINITFSTSDGRFNKTIQKSLTVRYGDLVLEWYASTTPPSRVEPSQTFNVKAVVTNDGTLNATSVSIDLTYDSSYFELSSGSDPCSVGTLQAQDDYTCQWTMKAKTNTVPDSIIKATLAANNAILPNPSYIQREVEIISPAEAAQDLGATAVTELTTAPENIPSLSFIKPEISELTLSQAQSYSLFVSVKNTGKVSLTNMYLSISGIDPSIYSIEPINKESLAAGASRNFKVNISIPPSMEAKNYSLSLKAISDQSTWTKDLILTVKGIGIKFSGLENISVTPGEAKGYIISIQNTGGMKLNNVRISLKNIEEDRFTIVPKNISKLPQNIQQSCNLSFFIPKGEPIGQKDLALNIVSDEGNLDYKFILSILPDEEQKARIADLYHNLSKNFLEVLKSYERADPNKVNLTEVQEQLNITHQTLALINSSLEKGDYLEAKRLMDQAQDNLAQLELSLADVRESSVPGSIFQIIIFIVGAILVGMAVVYAIVPKKDPGKDYTLAKKSGVSSNETKNKPLLNIFKKSTKKDEHEEQREQILEEWRERYELGKRKKPYG